MTCLLPSCSPFTNLVACYHQVQCNLCTSKVEPIDAEQRGPTEATLWPSSSTRLNAQLMGYLFLYFFYVMGCFSYFKLLSCCV